jgi:glutamine amidotransferase
MSSVAIVDYGMGNLHSIAKAVQHADPNIEVSVTDLPSEILSADRVIFPGVGAAKDCMAALTERELLPVLREAAKARPFLGICLGMQLLLNESEENGGTACLGLLEGRVIRFANDIHDSSGRPLKIPHMGWNQVTPLKNHPLWDGIPKGSWFYFVHSYFVVPKNTGDVSATTDYPNPFACAIEKENVVAVQFHPEKSQTMGLRLLSNFLKWEPSA